MIKKGEVGTKVNKLQIDGINFIQRISFDNFNEGTHFKNTIYKAQGLTKTKVRIVGANAIYVTNKNRVFATSNKIQTDFKPKVKPSKNRKQQLQLTRIITKERASRFEGRFGKDKGKNKENRNSLEYIQLIALKLVGERNNNFRKNSLIFKNKN